MEPEPRQGIFLPDIDKISKEWKAVLAEQSAQWQAKIDHLSGLLDEAIQEIRSLKGVTVTINRGTDADGQG